MTDQIDTLCRAVEARAARSLESDLKLRARWCAENRSTHGPLGFKLADIAVRHGLTIAQVKREWRRVRAQPSGGTAPTG